VASVSLRCLAIAAECLTDRQSQEEVLATFEKIIKETGWQAGFIRAELMELWGWNASAEQQQMASGQPPNRIPLSGSNSLLNSAIGSRQQPVPSIPPGIVNPLLATADFSAENHPYQNHYVAPHSQLDPYQYNPYS
jgi:hypothetical protein